MSQQNQTPSANETNAETIATETKAKTRPTHRISFARITGTDTNGNDILGPAREIGAIWPRKNGKKGGLLKLDHIPVELTNHEGVLFVLPVEPKTAPNDQQPLV